MIQLFRVFFPSWKFFDGHSETPDLFYREVKAAEQYGEWITCIPKTGNRSWKNLFINTRENYLFAAHALVEYLKNDVTDGSDPTTSIQLVTNLVRFQIKSTLNPLKSFQFMLAYPKDLTSALYLSDTIEVQS